MAQNTLTFEKQVIEGTVAGSRTLITTRDTRWSGDNVTLAAGESITITSFKNYDEVLLIDTTSGDTEATLTQDSPSYTNGGSSATLAVSVENLKKGVTIEYAIGHTPVEAGWDVENEDYEEITVGEDTYYADPTSYATPIELEAGDTIRLATADPRGASTLIAIVTESEVGDVLTKSASVECEFVRLRDTGWTATEAASLIICGQSQYIVEDVEYQIVEAFTDEADTPVSSTQTYADISTSVSLEKGDVLTNVTSGKDIIIIDNETSTILDTIGYNETYAADSNRNVVLGGADANTSLSYTIDPVHPTYSAEYEGGSGILQLRHAVGAKVDVFGDAGIGYMLIHHMEGRELVRAVNMDGFDSMKFVSDGQIDECTINEFGSSAVTLEEKKGGMI